MHDRYHIEMALRHGMWALEWKELGCDLLAAKDILRAYNHIAVISNDEVQTAMMKWLLG